jgi:hypothetical protein
VEYREWVYLKWFCNTWKHFLSTEWNPEASHPQQISNSLFLYSKDHFVILVPQNLINYFIVFLFPLFPIDMGPPLSQPIVLHLQSISNPIINLFCHPTYSPRAVFLTMWPAYESHMISVILFQALVQTNTSLALVLNYNFHSSSTNIWCQWFGFRRILLHFYN